MCGRLSRTAPRGLARLAGCLIQHRELGLFVALPVTHHPAQEVRADATHPTRRCADPRRRSAPAGTGAPLAAMAPADISDKRELPPGTHVADGGIGIAR